MMILLHLYDDTFSASIVTFPSPIPMIPVIKKIAQKMKEILEELNVFQSLNDTQLSRLGVSTIGDRIRLTSKVRSELQTVQVEAPINNEHELPSTSL